MSSILKKTPGKLKTILLTGLLTAALDGIAACIWNYGINPARVARFIASGAFDRAAFTGGAGMVLWGIFFHCLIAFSFTAVLFILYPFFIRVLKNKYSTAILFALITWLVTNLIIVPLSRIGWRPMEISVILIGFGILIFTIGLPIALIAGRYYSGLKKI